MKKSLVLLIFLFCSVSTLANAQANGVAGGTVSGQANGVIPLATGPSLLGAQSHLSDNGSAISSTELISSPVSCASGSVGSYCPPAAALLPSTVMDVRFISGVDCTGATDSSAALNALTNVYNGITGKILLFPPGCTISINTQWLIYGSEAWKLQGVSYLSGSPSITYCGASPGATSALKIERSGGWTIDGLTISSGKSGCSNTAAAGIIIDNDSSGGYTTTDGLINRSSISPSINGGTIPSNWIGVNISPVAVNNVEDIRILYSKINCGGSPGSIGVSVGLSFNAKMETLRGTQISSCTSGVDQGNGDFYLDGADTAGNNAAITLEAGSDPALITKVVSEDQQLLNSFASSANFPTTILASHIGWNGAMPGGVCGIDYGPTTGQLTLIGSGTDAVQPGSGSFPICGNETTLTLVGNRFYTGNGVLSSGSSFILPTNIPSGKHVARTFGIMNGGHFRAGMGNSTEDIGYGFIGQFGQENLGLSFNADSSSDGANPAGIAAGKDSLWLGNQNIQMNGMWPIPGVSVGCAYSGTAGSASWNVRVFAIDAAGRASGDNQEGFGACGVAAATLDSSDQLTVTWPRVSGAVSYDVVVADPSDPSGRGILGINQVDPGTGMTASATFPTGANTISAASVFNYVFPIYWDSAITTVNGEKFQINAPASFSGGFTTTPLVNPTAAPSGSVYSTTGGTIAAGTYYAKVVAVSQDGVHTTLAGPESGPVTTTGSTSVIRWLISFAPCSTFPGFHCQIWVGTSPGSENSYFPASSEYTLQTTTSGTPGTLPARNSTGDGGINGNFNVSGGVQAANFQTIGSSTALSGTTAGTANWSQPQQGTTWKQAVVYLNGYENTTATAQTITLPASFATVGYVVTDGGDCTGVTISGATITLQASTGATQTGLCEVRGY